VETLAVKFLFFDIGGILLTNGWGHESRQEAARLFNLDYKEMSDLHTFIFNVYEASGVDLDEYIDTVVFNRPRDFTREDFKKFMFDQSKELPDMLAWLKEWKKDCGFRIISINNEGKELNDYRINLKAELEIRHLHDKIDHLLSKQWQRLAEIQELQIEIMQSRPR